MSKSHHVFSCTPVWSYYPSKAIWQSSIHPRSQLTYGDILTNNSLGYLTPWRHNPDKRKRQYPPPLLILLLTNMRYIRNKTDKLFLLIQPTRTNNNCPANCLTETWLDHTSPDQAVTLPCFSLTGQPSYPWKPNVVVSVLWSVSAGVAKLCNTTCSPHLEYISVKCRLSYLLREFAAVTVIGVCILPSVNSNTAITEIATCIFSVENSHPDAAAMVLGNFNHTNLSTDLPNYINTFIKWLAPAEASHIWSLHISVMDSVAPSDCWCLSCLIL